MSRVVGVVARGRGRRVAERASQRTFFAVCALLFAASAAITIVWCASMSAMGGMPIPGGWTTSMAWMRMPGQTWLGAGASFLGMWVVMMVAMMLPSLVPIASNEHLALLAEAGLRHPAAFRRRLAARLLIRG